MKNLKRLIVGILLSVISLLNGQAQDSTTVFTEVDSGDKTHLFKLNASALGLRAIILSYERLKSPNRIIETTLKLVQFDFKFEDQSIGCGIDFGWKMKWGSLHNENAENKTNHLMAGGYVKPVVGTHLVQEGISDLAFFLNTGIDFGKQWIFNNKIAVDAFIGYHLVLGNKKTSTDLVYGYVTERPDRIVNAGDLYVSGNHALSFGVKIGLLYGSTYKLKIKK